MKIKTAIGQDSHKFDYEHPEKKLILAGIIFENEIGLLGNSDADVVLHSITNAISGITGVNILGKISDEICLNQGIKDSKVYLAESLKYLKGFKISNISISLECKRPAITPKIDAMKIKISELLNIDKSDVGITATTGEELTAFGRGEGIQVFCIVTAIKQ